MSFGFIGSNPNLTPEVHHPVKGEWAGFRNFFRFKRIQTVIGSKLTNSLTVATIIVTKPFIHNGFNRHDNVKVKFFDFAKEFACFFSGGGKEVVKKR